MVKAKINKLQFTESKRNSKKNQRQHHKAIKRNEDETMTQIKINGEIIPQIYNINKLKTEMKFSSNRIFINNVNRYILFKIHNRLIIRNIHNEMLFIICVYIRLMDISTNTCIVLTLIKFEFIGFRIYIRLLEYVANKISHNVIQQINNNKLDLIIAVGYIVFVHNTLINILTELYIELILFIVRFIGVVFAVYIRFRIIVRYMIKINHK